MKVLLKYPIKLLECDVQKWNANSKKTLSQLCLMHIAKSPLRPQKFRFSLAKAWYKLRSKEKGAAKSFQLPHPVCWRRFYADIYKEDIFTIFWYILNIIASPFPWYLWALIYQILLCLALTKLNLPKSDKKLLQFDH